MRKVIVILENAPESELDRAEIEVTDDGCFDFEQLRQAAGNWVLSAGDVLRFVDSRSVS
jgi:hypothetical protein